jgi:hypothetical protein
VVVRKALRRSQVIAFFKALPPCLIGMECCATSHDWARELTKLGHAVRLMPAKDVKAYLKRNKNDAADAAAICEAVRRLPGEGAVLSRHFLTFFIVTLIAYSPALLIASVQTTGAIEPSEALSQALWALLGLVLLMVLSTLSYAIILHATFQDMRRRPVRLAESLNVGLSRFLPLIGLGFVGGFLIVLGSILVIVPGLILYTMWFVGVPACVVERLGPWTSLRRSRELTKGYRWKLFALALLLLVANLGSSLIASVLGALAGPIAGLGGQLIWSGIWAAFSAIAIAVTYYDLRVIKEGVDIEQITAVFD